MNNNKIKSEISDNEIETQINNLLTEIGNTNSEIALLELYQKAKIIASSRYDLLQKVNEKVQEAKENIGFERVFMMGEHMRLIREVRGISDNLDITQEGEFGIGAETFTKKDVIQDIINMYDLLFGHDEDKNLNKQNKVIRVFDLLLEAIRNPHEISEDQKSAISILSQKYSLGINFDDNNNMFFSSQEELINLQKSIIRAREIFSDVLNLVEDTIDKASVSERNIIVRKNEVKVSQSKSLDRSQ